MNLTASEIRTLVERLFPDAPGVERSRLELAVGSVLEGKDVGKFKGEISPFKQQALDIANSLPRPVMYRKSAAKNTASALNKVVDEAEADMIYWLKRYRSPEDYNKISVTQFKDKMKWVLKDAYRKAYDLGTEASGIGRSAPGLTAHQGVDEKRWLDSVYSQEQKYFNRFLQDLISGQSQTMAEVRIRNYANAIRSVYEASRTVQLPEDVLIYWVLESGNPCSECRLLHRHSPYTKDTLPTTPKAGSTRCLSYCYCKLRIVKAKQSEVERVARRNRSAEYVLRQLRQSRKRH
jgi:hypothetical protein